MATAAPAAAQTFEIVGTRAAGMGGAFVAVADDASATYWNPGGLALGRMFSAVVDSKVADQKAGSLDDPSWFQPQLDFFVSDAQPWDQMDAALPKFEHYPPPPKAN